MRTFEGWHGPHSRAISHHAAIRRCEINNKEGIAMDTHPYRAALRAVAAGLVLAAGAAQADITHGPMLQAVTSDQAGIWLRTSIDQSVRVQLTAPDGEISYTDPVVTSLADSDDTARFVLTGLLPNSTYTYQIGLTNPDDGTETWTGSYALHTVDTAVTSMNIAVLADFRDNMTPSTALVTALAARPDLLAVIGDLDHRGPARGPDGNFYPPEDWPLVLAGMRQMHRDTRDAATPLGSQFDAGLVGTADSGLPQIPWIYGWDDHDFCANNADETCPFAPQAFQAWEEYFIPAPDNAFSAGCEAPGDYQSLTYGNLVQVFLLDNRSNRDDTQSNGPTGDLGACQHQWLVNGLHASTATWKVVLSSVPLNPTMKPWDAWSMFLTERQTLLDEIADVPNIVVLSGDVHSGGAIDDGTYSGLPEVSVPHADMPKTLVNTFCKVSGGTLITRPGAWTIGSILDPNVDIFPPNCLSQKFPKGVQIDRLRANVYPLDGHGNPGYAWITATPGSLTISVRNSKGKIKKGQLAGGHPAQMILQLQAQ
jgi:alkaline phosphatase D